MWVDWEGPVEVEYRSSRPSTATGSMTFHGVSSSEPFEARLLQEEYSEGMPGGTLEFSFSSGNRMEFDYYGWSSPWSWDPLAEAFTSGGVFASGGSWWQFSINPGGAHYGAGHAWQTYDESERGHWALVSDPRDVTVYAGAGDDVIHGGPGDQVLDGGDGDDAVRLGQGDGLAFGQDGDDALHGGVGTQMLNGGAGDDLLVGGRGAQTLRGGTGRDELRGGDGSQILLGGGGGDVLRGGSGTQVLDGGDDRDVLVGGQGAQVLRGGGGADELRGGVGDQTLLGGVGDDVLWAGDGTQLLRGEAGRDVLHAGGGGTVTLFGGAGRDAFVFHDAFVGGGAALVADFRPGQDIVLLDSGVVAGDLGAYLRSNEAGDAVLVGDNGATLTLAAIFEARARAHVDDWFVLAA